MMNSADDKWTIFFLNILPGKQALTFHANCLFFFFFFFFFFYFSEKIKIVLAFHMNRNVKPYFL